MCINFGKDDECFAYGAKHLVVFMRLLTLEECESLKSHVAATVGKVIKYYREKRNISGEQLGDCLDVSASVISRYESGKADIGLSKMALASAYCKFPLSTYFEVHESKSLMDTFSRLVEVEGNKYKRHRKYLDRIPKERKVLKARVYQVGDEEVVEEIPVKIDVPVEPPTRQDYFYGDVVLNVAPCTEQDFVCYLNDDENKEVCQLMISVGKVLECMDGAAKKEKIKGELAELVLGELIVDKVLTDNTFADRAYMYYRELLKKKTDEI